jgi:hemoglobin/transferrin/lactoferrin receptor protein
MKIIITVVITFCSSLIIQAQTIEVVDKNSLLPISNVQVFSRNNPTNILTTNQSGKIDISILGNAEEITFQNAMYSIATYSLARLKELHYTVYLSDNNNTLDEVVISASKFEEKRKDVVQKIQVLNTRELQHMNQSSTADVLNNSGNIMVQKSQQGGGSPIIRGFETNKVLLVVDGVRMNNAIYRGGHLQNVITLDNAVMEKIELVYGAGSVVYGSDALGGVMHFYTKNPLLSDTNHLKVKASAYTRYQSANSGFAEHADISVGSKKMASLTSFTYASYGDLKQGSKRNPFYGNFGARPWYVAQMNGNDSLISNPDTNLQVGSGYSQIDFLQKFLFKQTDQISHIVNVQYSTSSEISRYDRLVQTSNGAPKYADWHYGPQKRAFASYTLHLEGPTRGYDHARLIAGYQNIEESRIDRKYKKVFENHRIEKLNIFTFNADFSKKIKEQELRYGIDGFYNIVNSSAFSRNIVNDTISPINTRYPDGGSSMSSVATYLTHTWEINEKFIINDGIRFSNVDLKAKFIDQSYFPFPFSRVAQNNNALNGNVGLVYMPCASFRLTAGVASGFRAPNVDDLSKVFESTTGNLIVPNPDLKPEYTYTYEVGLSQTFHKKIMVSLNGYWTDYRNALTVQPFPFEGQDSIYFNGAMSQVTSTVNAKRGYIYGLEGGLSGKLNDNLSVLTTFNYTYGRIVTDTTDYPLDHIAPLFGKISLNYKNKKIRGELFVQYSGWKKIADYNIIGGEDNELYATQYGMPAWYTTNLRLTYQFNKSVSFQAACENIFDQNYRQFASNISGAGRNFIFTLRGNI